MQQRVISKTCSNPPVLTRIEPSLNVKKVYDKLTALGCYSQASYCDQKIDQPSIAITAEPANKAYLVVAVGG